MPNLLKTTISIACHCSRPHTLALCPVRFQNHLAYFQVKCQTAGQCGNNHIQAQSGSPFDCEACGNPFSLPSPGFQTSIVSDWVQQTTSKVNSSKCPPSPSATVKQKVAKKPLTITSHGQGSSSTFAARSWQAAEAHNNMDLAAPQDVLLNHHVHNGILHAPDPAHLASLANNSQTQRGMGPSAIQGPGDVKAQNIVTGMDHGTINNNPTTLN